MALQARELWSKTTRAGHPRIEPIDVARVVVLEATTNATAYELAVGTPMVWSATGWTQWDASKTVIDGFVYPKPITVSGAGGDGDVLGVVMTSGQIHYDDIPKEADFTQDNLEVFTQATLDAELRNMTSNNRKLRIDGLSGVR